MIYLGIGIVALLIAVIAYCYYTLNEIGNIGDFDIEW